MRERLRSQLRIGTAADTIGGSPQVFADHIRNEREKWSKLLRERNITLN